MALRLDYETYAPEGMGALAAVYRYIGKSGLEAGLIDLVYLRISHINGCSYCIDLHTRDGERHGIATRKMHLVGVSREVELFTERERAALEWAELLTRVADRHPSDSEYERVKAHFTDGEIANLTIAIGLMNAYNRVAIGFGRTPS